MSLDSAIQHLLKAKRISAPTQSYAKDNPNEWQKVKAYLEGGQRPTGVTTEMGVGLIEVEDARREEEPPPPPPPPPPDGVPVPASIDATGQTDVTSALNSFIGSVPNGERIIFGQGKIYRVNGVLSMNSRQDLIFDLTGTTIRETTIGDGHQSKLRFNGGSNITVLGGRFEGAFSTPGVHDVDNQWGHALDFLGTSGVTVVGGFAQNMCGDGIYLGANSQKPCTNVSIKDFSSTGVGRNGISFTGVHDCLVEGGKHDNVGFIGLDVEPNAVNFFTVQRLVIDGTEVGKYRLAGAAVCGHNTVNDVTFQNMKFSSTENKQRVGLGWETLGPNLTRRFTNIKVLNCTATNSSGVGIGAARIDGCVIQGNVMPVTNMLRTRDVTGLTFTGNQPNTQTSF